MVLATGRPLKDWQEDEAPAILDISRVAKIFLIPDREELLRRIDVRFDAMIAAGALEEVRALAARRLDPELPAMKAHGVPWLIRHLNGEMTLTQAAAEAKRDTRQYTKRQATWFRNQLPEFAWVEPGQKRSPRSRRSYACWRSDRRRHSGAERSDRRRAAPPPMTAKLAFLVRDILQPGRIGGAAYDARYAELDLPGRGSDDAAHGQRALADLAPAGEFAL